MSDKTSKPLKGWRTFLISLSSFFFLKNWWCRRRRNVFTSESTFWVPHFVSGIPIPQTFSKTSKRLCVKPPKLIRVQCTNCTYQLQWYVYCLLRKLSLNQQCRSCFLHKWPHRRPATHPHRWSSRYFCQRGSPQRTYLLVGLCHHSCHTK